MNLRLAVAVLAPILALACSPYSLAEPTTPPMAAFGPARPDAGTVCVIRPSRWALAVTFAIHDNGQIVGATRGESYFCYVAEPGEHVIVSDTNDPTDTADTTAIAVLPGRRYWLHQDFTNTLGSITSKLAWLEEARAKELAAECDYKVLVGVPGEERVPDHVPTARARRVP